MQKAPRTLKKMNVSLEILLENFLNIQLTPMVAILAWLLINVACVYASLDEKECIRKTHMYFSLYSLTQRVEYHAYT